VVRLCFPEGAKQALWEKLTVNYKEIDMEILKRLIFTLLLFLPTVLFAAETVNINTADVEALMSIKGIGEKRAQAIIEYREQHGPFKSVDQLMEIKGVGRFFVDTNREYLVTEEHNR
jgi:competence protein ComEA